RLRAPAQDDGDRHRGEHDQRVRPREVLTHHVCSAPCSTPASRSAGKTTCPSRYRTLYAQNGMTCPLGRTWWMQHFISRRTSKLYASKNDVIVIRNTSDWASCSDSARAKNSEASCSIGPADRCPLPS